MSRAKREYPQDIVDEVARLSNRYKHTHYTSSDIEDGYKNFNDAFYTYLKENEDSVTTDSSIYPSYFTPRELRVLELYYKAGMTLEETGKELGVTRERISQVCMKLIRKIVNKPVLMNYIFIGINLSKHIESVKDRKLRETSEATHLVLELHKLNEQAAVIIQRYNEILPEVKATSSNVPLEELNLSIRTYNCLRRNEIHTLSDLLALEDTDILKMRNMGRKSSHEIREKVKQYTGNDYFKGF